MEAAGIEPLVLSPQKQGHAATGDAESDAVGARIDPDLARIVAAWPTLPEPIRRAMLALIG
jgi:hypothetical protein